MQKQIQLTPTGFPFLSLDHDGAFQRVESTDLFFGIVRQRSDKNRRIRLSKKYGHQCGCVDHHYSGAPAAL
jgi:hypothetical protein